MRCFPVSLFHRFCYVLTGNRTLLRNPQFVKHLSVSIDRFLGFRKSRRLCCRVVGRRSVRCAAAQTNWYFSTKSCNTWPITTATAQNLFGNSPQRVLLTVHFSLKKISFVLFLLFKYLKNRLSALNCCLSDIFTWSFERLTAMQIPAVEHVTW